MDKIKDLTPENFKMKKDSLKRSQAVFRALNHPLRQNIISFLLVQGASCVTVLYKHFRIEQSVASTQLAILRRAGILTTKREGQTVYYSVNEKRVITLCNLSMEINANTEAAPKQKRRYYVAGKVPAVR